ncbi:Diacylglycerol O-acyltransferase 1 [Escovopsis weberi]|uniref:diacylglycerol O-acyltransferase n=1 Tax=Escovopsis weberi TaxID=150374 RepID=A0A0M9VT82_ESCWE|nr:Diacylglycerol O-acyltransferase 1 [Escovopsis weberi]
MENIQKYGVLICLRCHDFRSQDLFLGIVLYFSIPCHLLVAYLIELAVARSAQASRKRKVRASEKTFDDYNDNNNNNNNNNNNEKNTSGVDGVDGNEDAGPSEEDQRAFRLTWIVAAFLHGINITLALAITTFVVYFHVHHPLIGTLTELHAIIVWLKTASYAFTNRDLRHAYLHSSPSSSSSSSLASSSPPDKSTDIGATAADEAPAIPELYKSCPYPQNITMANLVYFWWAPTLVYQPVYPRTARVRWVFVAKRVCEIFCLGVFIWVASAQYAAPVLRNSLGKIASLDVFSILERLLKLSTISLAIWLAGFFALFQSFLNALAEVLRFGDRSFYDDWWNSESLGAYWRTWNKPVYTYFKRHVYVPMVGRGWSHGAASCAVFFVSAVLHEIAVGVPTHNIIGVAFLGMFLQLPLIAMTSPLEKMKLGHGGRILGNVIFWVSFTIFGQPFAALMYFYAWQAKYGSASRTMGGTSMSTSMSTSVGDSV